MPESAGGRSKLHEDQYAFAAHLRDPLNNPAPEDVEDRRMAIYRDLFINNVTNFLGQSFPVLSDLLGEQRWKMLIRDFYRDHQSHSPLFPDLPKEFLDYLANERPEGKHTDEQNDPAFIYELAHYEWVETGLALADAKPERAGIQTDGDLLADHPAISSLAWLFAYTYPVNEIGKEHQPDTPADQPVHMLLYRSTSGNVKFIKLNIVSARLFEVLNADETVSGEKALAQIAAELNHPDPAKVISGGSRILEQWRDKGIVLGALPV